MKELNTKNGVFLTTYTQKEIDDKTNEFNVFGDAAGCDFFKSKLRSLNDLSKYKISEKEASKLVGLEVKKNKKNLENLYTNYIGNPFGLSINEVKLYFKEATKSLESAFKSATPEFDLKKDFFHIFIVE